jgi:gamma-aminobutyric acid receptor subunit alpha
MCVLSLATLSFDVRNDIPSVPYVTALDWFLIMCYLFLFASLLEFTIVHYFTKVGYGDYYMIIENESLLDEDVNPLTNTRYGLRPSKFSFGGEALQQQQQQQYPPLTEDMCQPQRKTFSYNLDRFWKCITSDPIYKKRIKKKADDKGINSVSKCDKISRIIFPGAFLFLNIIYWNTYYKSG